MVRVSGRQTLFGCAWGLLLVTALAWGDNEFLKVKMAGEADGKDVAAREAAIRAAEARIISETLKSVVLTEDLRHFSSLLANGEQYLRATQLLEFKIDGNRTLVEVEGLVKRNELMRDAAEVLLSMRGSPPSVLLLIKEHANAAEKEGGAKREGKAVTAVAGLLKKAGLSIADPALIMKCYSESELGEIATGDAEGVTRVARQGFADVIVTGEVVCSSEPPPTGGNVMANRATVTLRVFRGSDGKLTDAFSQGAVVRSVDSGEGVEAAIVDACAKLTREFPTAVILATAGAAGPETTLVSVETPGDRSRFDQVLQKLKTLVGNERVHELFFTDTLARVRIDYQDALPPLLDSVTEQPYDGVGLKVQRAVGREVVLRFER